MIRPRACTALLCLFLLAPHTITRVVARSGVSGPQQANAPGPGPPPTPRTALADAATASDGDNIGPPPPPPPPPPYPVRIDGVGLSVSGFLLTYQLGALQELIDAGAVTPGETPMAGASGGALVAAALGLGHSIDDVLNASLAVMGRCGRERCRGGALAEEMQAAFDELVPTAAAADDYDENGSGNYEDTSSGDYAAAGGWGEEYTADWERCNGLCYVQVSYAADLPGHACTSQPKAGELVGGFASAADLQSALAASSFIPNTSRSGACTTPFRGRGAMDGLYTRPLPCPPGTAGGGGGSSVAIGGGGLGLGRCVRIDPTPLELQRIRDERAHVAQQQPGSYQASGGIGAASSSSQSSSSSYGSYGSITYPDDTGTAAAAAAASSSFSSARYPVANAATATAAATADAAAASGSAADGSSSSSSSSSAEGPPDIYPGVRGPGTAGPVSLALLLQGGTLDGEAMADLAPALWGAGRLDARHWLAVNGYYLPSEGEGGDHA